MKIKSWGQQFQPQFARFFAIEIPHMDGAEFALEAYSACVVAGVVGTIVGHCIWNPQQLLGHLSNGK